MTATARSSREEIERAVAALSAAKTSWPATSIDERLELLARLRRDTLDAAEDWARAGCELKSLDFDAPVSAEEWLAGPILVIRNLRLLEKTLRELRDQGEPAAARALRTRPDGRVLARVFPCDRFDSMLYQGFTADVLLERGVGAATAATAAGGLYRRASNARGPGRVALVLGAGNVSSIGPMDVLSKLFVENAVCVLKMHPVNAAVGPTIERAFRALSDRGLLRVVYGGADEGALLVEHDAVDEIHITGSDTVHDRIVWGSGEEGEEARRANRPRIGKRVTSELGCVTPVIVAPGDWSGRELRFQAENVASMVTNNASFNCNAAKVIVTHSGWGQRQPFLDAISEVFAGTPPRHAYYPGSEAKYDAFIKAHPDARRHGDRANGRLPWALAPGLDPSRRDDIAFRVEAWSPVVAETAIGAESTAAFFDRAVAFANETLPGTLSCSLIVDPRTARAESEALERAVDALRYGSVAVNHWPALSYAFCSSPWGAYPGHTLRDIGSGIGFVHNTAMLESIEKAIVRGPFVASPKPAWFVTHRRARGAAPRIARFEAAPGVWRLLRVVMGVLGG